MDWQHEDVQSGLFDIKYHIVGLSDKRIKLYRIINGLLNFTILMDWQHKVTENLEYSQLFTCFTKVHIKLHWTLLKKYICYWATMLKSRGFPEMDNPILEYRLFVWQHKDIWNHLNLDSCIIAAWLEPTVLPSSGSILVQQKVRSVSQMASWLHNKDLPDNSARQVCMIYYVFYSYLEAGSHLQCPT